MKKLESENNLVVRANQLVEAKYRLTATEQKIVYILTSMVHKDDEDFKPYIMRIEDLMALIDTDSHSKYTEVKVICRNLMKKVFTIHDTLKKEEIMVNWFSSINYKYGQGLVEFEFSPYLKPLMLQLKCNFTRFSLNNVMQLRSGYSLRLYELLKQYENIGKRQFQITELRELMGIPKSEYPRYPNFKQRVLIQAQKEINAKTNIMFEFEEIKEGKKVTAIKFIIFKKREAIMVKPELSGASTTTDNARTEKNIVCVDNSFTQKDEDIENIQSSKIDELQELQKEIKKVTGQKISIERLSELLASSSVERIKYHLENWHIHKEHQKLEGAGWFFTVIKYDITPEKKKTGFTGENGKVPQRDNFEQRKYSREFLDSFYADLTEDKSASQPEPKSYTYIDE